MDLNMDSDEDDGDEDMTFMEREKEELEKLKNACSACFKCGSEKVCLIAKNGAHVQLTLNQQRAWASALVSLVTHSGLRNCTHKLSHFQGDGFPKCDFEHSTKRAVIPGIFYLNQLKNSDGAFCWCT